MKAKTLLCCFVVLSLMLVLASAEEKKATPTIQVKLELPEPFFGGTPLPYESPNLEPEDYKDRNWFLAPEGTQLLSRGKPVSSSSHPLFGITKMLTDGDKGYAKNSMVELGDGVQWIQVDLEASKNICAVLLWHFHMGKRVYFDVVVLASDDPEFKSGVTTLYNNDMDNSAGLGVGKDKEYIENYKGRLFDAKGIKSRYVRLYSNGNTDDDKNDYIEVEIFGK